jgi:hypothetical protein
MFIGAALGLPLAGVMIGATARTIAEGVGVSVERQADHINAGFLAVLGSVVLTLAVAFIVELRLKPIATDANGAKEVAALEQDRRNALAGFAAGALVGVISAAGGIFVADIRGEDYVHDPQLVAILTGPAVAAVIFLLPLLVALAMQSAATVRDAERPRRRCSHIRRALHRAALWAELVVLTIVTVGLIALTVAVGAWLLWVMAGSLIAWWWIAGGSRTKAVATVERPVALRSFVALSGAGLAVIVAAASTLPYPDPSPGVKVASYGFTAAVIAGLLVVFAAGHPLRNDRSSLTREQIARWCAGAAIGAVGVLASLWGSAAEGGPFAFWGTGLALVVLAFSLVRYSRTTLLSWGT